MIQWLQLKKMYIVAIAIALATIVFFFMNRIDTVELMKGLLVAAGFAALSSRLKSFLPMIVQGLKDARDKNANAVMDDVLQVGASTLLPATSAPSVVVNVHPPATASVDAKS